MNVVPIKKFSPYIVPLAENCPEFLMEQAVTATVADICKATGCLTTRTCFVTKKDESEYDLDLNRGLNAELVRSVYCGGVQVESARLDELDRRFGLEDWRPASGVPRYYTFLKPARIIFCPAPAEEMFVTVTVTCSVNRDTQTVPDFFLNDYLDVVVNGALARIYRVAGQTYTNVRLADECQKKYEDGLKDIQRDVYRDFTRSTGRVFYNRIV